MASSAEQSPSTAPPEEVQDLHHVKKLTSKLFDFGYSILFVDTHCPSEHLIENCIFALRESFVRGTKSAHDTSETCRVCGDGHARMHYGVLTCFGCKGFFRRTLKRSTEYSCKHSGNCIVDRHERNSCRYCRFKRCLEVGMDPKAVRPDRDATGRHYQARVRRSKMFGDCENLEEVPIGDDWSRKLSVDMRTTLMQLMNIELIVNKGDSSKNAKDIYPLPFSSLQQILSDPTLLDGSRTEMRYEPYRKVENDELLAIAHRRLIAIIDWVDHLSDIMDLHSTEDKLTLVKSGFAPLTIFTFSAATAKCTKDRDIMCLCNFGFVPRDVHRVFDEPYQLRNRVIDKALDELVAPFRALHFNDEEIVLLKAIIVLNPHLKTLTQEASEQIADLRDRIQETLYNVVRETHPKEVASSRFGNLLLFIPAIMMLGNVMYENLQFAQTFGKQNIDPLLCELLDNIEPLDDSGFLASSSQSYDEGRGSMMRPSTSSSSVSSLASQESLSSYTPSEDCTQDSETESQRSLLSPQQSFGPVSSVGSAECPGITNACSLPNLDQVESDPDYNVTLTADMFTGMRQAISAAQNMDVDTHHTPPNSPEFGYTPLSTPRPHFFLDENNRTMTTERFGNRHKFTITARRMGADKQDCSRLSNGFQSFHSLRKDCQTLQATSPIPIVNGGIPIANGFSVDHAGNTSHVSPSYGSYPGTQMPVMKTHSCPRSIPPGAYIPATHSVTAPKKVDVGPHLVFPSQTASNGQAVQNLQTGAQRMDYEPMDFINF